MKHRPQHGPRRGRRRAERARARDRRGTAAATVAAVLALTGLGLIGYAWAGQQTPPQPTAAGGTVPVTHVNASASTASSASPASSSLQNLLLPPQADTKPTPGRSAMPASKPVALYIPAIDVVSQVARVGLTTNNTVEVPRGPTYNRAAWYKHSPTPGETGASVIVGHVDSASGGPSVFYRLGALRPGDTVKVTRADQSVATFTVDAVRSYPKNDFPTRMVYGDTDRATLRLITCGGSYNDATGHYRDNIVAFAHRTSPQPREVG